MKTKQEGIGLIKKCESLELTPYLDDVGVWTIGYGHTKNVDASTPPITEKEAEELLRQDLEGFERQLNIQFSGLSQNKFDALVSLVFNIGYPHFAKSRLYQLIIKNPKDKYISSEWIEFRNAGGIYFRGLLLRRLDELKLYYRN